MQTLPGESAQVLRFTAARFIEVLFFACEQTHGCSPSECFLLLASGSKLTLRVVSELAPNRINTADRGPMTTPAADNNVPVVHQSGLGSAVLPQWVTVAMTVVVAVCGVVVGLPAMGVALPAAVISVCSVIVSIGAAIGIASPGLRKKE